MPVKLEREMFEIVALPTKRVSPEVSNKRAQVEKSQKMTKTIGLDVGGAHLKVAILENRKLTGAHQFVCPLWLGLDNLDSALAAAKHLTADADQIAITMTGELSDLFDSREQGVHTLVDRLTREYGDKTRFWMATRGFGTAEDAKTFHHDVGSTNFLATAHAVAQHTPNAVLIDMGSTTTDIIAIINGKPCPRGLTDAARQQTGELVYTGLTRTSVMAITNRVPFNGQWQSMAREHLATMADVYRLLGTLPEGVDQHDTADGRGKSQDESRTRLARMLSRDDEPELQSEAERWKLTAQYIANEQLKSIEEGVFQVLSANPELNAPTIITAGIGAHIAAKLAKRQEIPHIAFGELVGAPADIQDAITHNAPAAAVALLSTTP